MRDLEILPFDYYFSPMRFVFFLFLSVYLPGVIHAQSPARRVADLSIGWSVADRIGYMDDIPFVLPAQVRNPLFPGEDARHTGCITGSFMFSVGRGWSLGFALSYAKLAIPGTAHFSRQGFSFAGRHVFSRTVMAAEARKVYFSRHGLSGYARLGLGAAQRDYDFEFEGGGRNKGEDRSAVAMHISPIGLSYGGRVRAFMEFGYGYRGLVSLGAALRF